MLQENGNKMTQFFFALDLVFLTYFELYGLDIILIHTTVRVLPLST